MRIEYNVPHEYVAELENFMRKYSWLVPSWVKFIKIEWAHAENTTATSEVNYDYLNITIELGFQYRALYAHDRERLLVHELCHAYTTPLSEIARNNLSLVECDKVRDTMKEVIRRSLEQCTSHLEHAIFDYVNKEEST